MEYGTVEDALKFATKKHEGSYRKTTNEPYIVHPIRVAEIMKENKQSKNIDLLLKASYLHDTVENTDTTFEEIRFLFGNDVSSLVKEVTMNKEIKKRIGKLEYLLIELREMSSYGFDLKLCDRLDNISDLAICPKEFRDRYLEETVIMITFSIENREITRTQKILMLKICNTLLSLHKLYIEQDNKEEIFEQIEEDKKLILSLEPAPKRSYVIS